MKSTKIFLQFFSRLIFLALLTSPLLCSARDLQGRLGLGYNSQFINSVPSISIKYALSRDLAFQGILGSNTASPSSTAIGGKFHKMIFLETNLNFYFFAGAAFVSANSKSGGDFIGGFGSEFFIPGIESLGFSIETGAGLSNLTGSMAFRTLGLSFLSAGVHFYF